MKCATCSTDFRKEHPYQHKCPECRKRACKRCGARFMPVANQQYCSDACRKPPAPVRPEKYHRFCERCGEKWYPSDRSIVTMLCGVCRKADRQKRVYSQRKHWRRAILERANHACEECGRDAQESGAPLQVHHMIHEADGGLMTLANGKALCVTCHVRTHGGEGGGSGAGWSWAPPTQRSDAGYTPLATPTQPVVVRITPHF